MFKVKEGIELFGDAYLKHPTGNYGSVEIDGGSTGGYEGYSIGGRAVFMHDNSNATGLYDDVNNKWLFLGYHGGDSRLYHSGSEKFSTKSYGALISGRADISGGANIVSTSSAPFRWQRSGLSQTGQNDNVTVWVDDSNIYFTHNNDSDGDAGSYHFQYTTAGTATNILSIHPAYTWVRDAVRSPIYYDRDNTGRFVDPASTSQMLHINMNNGNLTGVNHITINDPGPGEGISWNGGNGWKIHESPNDMTTNSGGNLQFGRNTTRDFTVETSGYVHARKGMEFGDNAGLPMIQWSNTSSSTGAVRIDFPGTSANYGMVHMVIDVYEYNSTAASTIIIGGHNWNSLWYNYNCRVIGDFNKSVRLAFYNGKYCVLLGNSSSSWTYGTVVLRKVHNASFYNAKVDTKGFAISQSTLADSSYSALTGDIKKRVLTTDDSVGGGNYVTTDTAQTITGVKTFAANVTSSGNRSATFYAFNGSYVNASTDVRAPIFYDRDDTSTYIRMDGDGVGIRVGTASGYMEMGSRNSSHAHIYTDRPNFYFNKELRVDTGIIGSYNEDLELRRAGSTTDRITVGSGTTTFGNRIQNGSVWINNGSDSNGYNENIRLFNAPNGVSTIAFSATGVSGTPTTSVLGYSDRFETRIGATWRTRLYGGYLQVNGDTRATRFYDSNNTAYYCDPASTSIFNALTVNSINGYSTNQFMRRIAKASATIGGGWITVAQNTSGRRHGEVIVTDADSGDHGFIRIEWMRSYADSNFTVLNCGGHSNRITGARVLYQTSDITYGNYKLQVYVTASSNYEVNIYEHGDIEDYTGHEVVTPVVQNSISGYAVHGNELTELDQYGLAAEEGIRAGGKLKVDDRADIVGKVNIGGATEHTSSDNTGVVYGNPTANKLFVNGSIQLNGNSDAIVFGRGTSTFLKDEELAFGWGGGLYMQDGTYLRIRNNKSVYSAGDARFTTYYDSNDTGYYVNPAAGSKLVNLGLNTDPRTDSYRLSMGGHIHMNNYDINYVNQLHFNANVRFYDEGNDNYLNFKWGDGGSGGIKFYDGNSTFHGYIYGDGGGRFGLLDNDGNWAVHIGVGTEPLQLRCNNNVEFYVYDSYTYSPGSSRAPVFYDSNDTSYYANFADSGSAAIRINGSMRVHNQKGLYTSSSWIRNQTGYGYIDIGPANTGHAHIYTDRSNFYFNKTINSTGNVVAYASDKRLKTNCKPIENALEKVNNLTGMTYNWNSIATSLDSDVFSADEAQVGVFAQDVQEVLPEAVKRAPFDMDDGEQTSKSGEDYLTVQYEKMVPLLIEAIKEQQQQIEDLKSEIESLKM